jgi:hypothetical protein
MNRVRKEPRLGDDSHDRAIIREQPDCPISSGEVLVGRWDPAFLSHMIGTEGAFNDGNE